jgi:hypothetical protein
VTVQDEFSPAYSTAFDAGDDTTTPPVTVDCSWPVSYAACGTCEPLASMPASGQEMFEEMAGDYLRAWVPSVGLCPVTIRPCRANCPDGDSTFYGRGPYSGGPGWGPVLVGGSWYNLGCGRCGDTCSCDGNAPIRLPGPVSSVEQVVIDGGILDPLAYRVDNRSLLVRLDGRSWPTCQALGSPSAPGTGVPGTWQVTYTRGTPVPMGGQIAAGVLACELAKAACRDASCQLPQRVQSITRQGVTVAILDAFDDIDTGHTGIWIIDSWVASMTKPSLPSLVRSPDLPHPRNRRTTWPSA